MHPEHKKLIQDRPNIIAALVLRDGYRCANCGSDRNLRVDHIVSVREGGITDLDNLQLLCNRCNGIKGSTTADYRPADRGLIGLTEPRFTNEGYLIVRYGRGGGHWEDAVYEQRTGRETCSIVLIKLQRRVRVSFRNIHPIDLQHVL